jgi:hypothetical protein
MKLREGNRLWCEPCSEASEPLACREACEHVGDAVMIDWIPTLGLGQCENAAPSPHVGRLSRLDALTADVSVPDASYRAVRSRCSCAWASSSSSCAMSLGFRIQG